MSRDMTEEKREQCATTPTRSVHITAAFHALDHYLEDEDDFDPEAAWDDMERYIDSRTEKAGSGEDPGSDHHGKAQANLDAGPPAEVIAFPKQHTEERRPGGCRSRRLLGGVALAGLALLGTSGVASVLVSSNREFAVPMLVSGVMGVSIIWLSEEIQQLLHHRFNKARPRVDELTFCGLHLVSRPDFGKRPTHRAPDRLREKTAGASERVNKPPVWSHERPAAIVMGHR